jgi:DNA-binding CsgD family transcriptional regulator
MQCNACGGSLRRNNLSGVCSGCYTADSGPLNLPLTDRETELLQLIADGERYDSVAVKLDPAISEQSVKNHLNYIRRKLDASTTTEAVAKGIRAGLLV